MRKLIFLGLMAATALPTAVQAQSRAEIRRDRQDVREERRELQHARRYGDRRDIREEREELRDARRELREDRRDRRQHLRQRSRNYQRYYAPYSNWSYRPVYQGYQLRPSFYGSRYYAPGHRYQGQTRCIRYGDDLLLVNTRNGRVLQVRRNHYW